MYPEAPPLSKGNRVIPSDSRKLSFNRGVPAIKHILLGRNVILLLSVFRS